MLLEIFTIARTKKVILVVLIKVRLILLVARIGLSISIYDSKAYSSYSFKFLNIEISRLLLVSLLVLLLQVNKKIELFKVTNNYRRNNKVIRIVV